MEKLYIGLENDTRPFGETNCKSLLDLAFSEVIRDGSLSGTLYRLPELSVNKLWSWANAYVEDGIIVTLSMDFAHRKSDRTTGATAWLDRGASDWHRGLASEMLDAWCHWSTIKRNGVFDKGEANGKPLQMTKSPTVGKWVPILIKVANIESPDDVDKLLMFSTCGFWAMLEAARRYMSA